MAQLPPLPPIAGDYNIILDVYTHESARPPNSDMQSDEYGDVNRLQQLGRKSAEMAVVYHYFAMGTGPSSQGCMYSASDMPRLCAAALDPQRIIGWMDTYNMKKNIRCYPHSILESTEVMTRFFFTYVGALYIRNGPETIQRWISALLDPDMETPSIVSTPPRPVSPPSQPPAPLSPPPPMPMHQPSSPLVFQPTFQNTTPLGGTPVVDPLHQLITLQIFNQTAQQKGRTVTYQARSEGPPHQPLWTVICFVDGQEISEGRARSQKVAKEEAARQAFTKLGWP